MAAEPIFDYVGTYDEDLPLPERLTLDQYNRVFFRPDAHFIDGQIIPRTLGDSTHSHMIGDLIGAIHPACKASDLDACISLRLQISPTRVRVCDYVILQPDGQHEQVPTVAPLLCVEVITQGQMPEDEFDTLADCLAMGVENIWLIDPIRRAAYTFDAKGLHEADPAHLTVPSTSIHLDLTEAFAPSTSAVKG